MSPHSIDDIISKITAFLNTPNRSPALRDWQRLAGHLNWLLNVLPWGRPALTELYRKTSGKQHPYAAIPINATVITDLSWLVNVIPRSTGVRFVDAGIWSDDQADLVIWTDASLTRAIAFTYTGNGFVYPLKSPQTHSKDKIDIFFLELLAILSAIFHAASFVHPPRHLLIWTDSLDSVAVLDSLRASEPLHNGPLLAIADIILRSGIDLHVRHIEGKQNIRADMLSRLLLDEYTFKFPADRVRIFSPPRDLLPARWREHF